MDARQSPASDRPAMGDVGVLALVPDRWGDPWLARQQVLTRLAQYFQVLWINPAFGWRSSRWWKLWLQKRSYGDVSHRTVHASPGLTIYEPGVLLPDVGRPRLISRILERQRLRQASKILTERGCTKIILYLWRPHFAPALGLIPHAMSCYHIADEYTFSPVEKPLGAEEAALIFRVDQVFIHSPALMQKKGRLNANTRFVPNGVDYHAFSTPVGEPADMHDIPRPRIGYVGVIKRQLDLALLLTLARRHPGWSFVFVGPEKRSLGSSAHVVRELSSLHNVYFLGRKPVEILPGYAQHFDVCTLPYVMNGYTKFIYPLKLHEYLATGRPVVGAPIRSLLEFDQVISLASTAGEWSQALTNALSTGANDPAQVEARRAVARRHDWNDFVRVIAETLCERLGPAYRERLWEASMTAEDALVGAKPQQRRGASDAS